MSVRPLVQLTDINPRVPAETGNGTELRDRSMPVRLDADQGVLKEVIQDMIETMIAHPVCIGLSAIQIGLPMAISVISLSRDPGKDLRILVNPLIDLKSGKKDRKYESCMSVPGYKGQVESRDKLSCSFRDERLIEKRQTFSGFLARAVRHEIDHCYGILYAQHVEPGEVLETTDLFDYDTPESDPFAEGEIQLLTRYLCAPYDKGIEA